MIVTMILPHKNAFMLKIDVTKSKHIVFFSNSCILYFVIGLEKINNLFKKIDLVFVHVSDK